MKLTIKKAKSNRQLWFFQVLVSKFIHPPPYLIYHPKPGNSDYWNLEKLVTRNLPS